MSNKLLISKLREDAIIPSKRSEDAGYDIYANFKEEYMVLKPGTTTIIGTGIASAFDEQWCAKIEERGSTGTKGMAVRAGVFDSGYRGEWAIVITNVNNYPIVISKHDPKTTADLVGTKSFIYYDYNKAIAQFMMIEVPTFEIEEVEYKELKDIKSERGAGRIGSSGK